MIYSERKQMVLFDEAVRRGKADTSNLRACLQIESLVRAMDNDCARRLGERGLSEGRFMMLMILRDRTDGVSPQDVAERTDLPRFEIDAEIEAMERDGFIDPPDDEIEDGEIRSRLVRLSDVGQDVAEGVCDTYDEWLSLLFRGVSPRETQVLTELIGRMWRNMAARDALG